MLSEGGDTCKSKQNRLRPFFGRCKHHTREGFLAFSEFGVVLGFAARAAPCAGALEGVGGGGRLFERPVSGIPRRVVCEVLNNIRLLIALRVEG